MKSGVKPHGLLQLCEVSSVVTTDFFCFTFGCCYL